MLLESVANLSYGMLRRRLTLFAALFFGALGVLANGGVRVVHRFIVLRAVVARADLVAALGLLALAVLAFLVVGVVD